MPEEEDSDDSPNKSSLVVSGNKGIFWKGGGGVNGEE